MSQQARLKLMKTDNHITQFSNFLSAFVEDLGSYVSTEDGQWAIKGFIDIYRNIYTISTDTKIISKILELHLFPRIYQFANNHHYTIELAAHQNYYPDLTFIDPDGHLFAVDLKTTYRDENNPNQCRGFTLGSHGTYFIHRNSSKNIQHPYDDYSAHFCIGIIYDRIENAQTAETTVNSIEDLDRITSVIKNFQFFCAEKWRIASDKQGSSNTANIGSITNIDDLIQGNGVFAKYGENVFDDYWMNYGKIMISIGKRKRKRLSSLDEYLKYRRIPKK